MTSNRKSGTIDSSPARTYNLGTAFPESVAEMVEERTQRRLAAILAADVVGYSRLMEADEVRTLASLKHRRQNILKPLLTKHQGRIVKFMGDGVLVEFASAVNAVECAMALQQGMAQANESLNGDRHIVLRIGINIGDVMVEGSDLYGDGVNIAARLEALADPGSIFVSGPVYDSVRKKVDLTFEDLGSRSLKNISEPVRVYGVASTPAVATTAPIAAPSKPAIAVLPFTNMSGDPEQQYFSDGVTEDIITELSRFRSLLVIARNSSFQYRDKAVDVRRAARELGVRYIVEGSIRKMAERVRITAQLVDAVTGNHLWSERYDRNIKDLFEIQDEVTRTIVATLVARVEDAEITGARHKRTGSLAAYDRLLRGIELLRGYGNENNRRARELFESAVSFDPRFALAHAYLALSLLAEHRYNAAPASIKDQALKSGLLAVQLDPREGRCHQFLAEAYRYRGEFELAISHFERSIALNPNDANGIAHMGLVLATAGRAEEGARLIREAMLLNPFHPDWYWSSMAIASYAARRYDDALEANWRIANRTEYWPLARAAACLAQLGRLAEAREHAAEVLRLKPDFHLFTEKLNYKNSADAEHVFEGMRKAGLPE
jgi:adenylate cyclase